jgi:hypothetical protein
MEVRFIVPLSQFYLNKNLHYLITLRDYLTARGHQLEKLSIHWVCSAIGCLYEQVSPEFIHDFLGRTCPMLKELDISGLSKVTAFSLQQFLDTKLSQVILMNFGRYDT